MSKAKKSKNEDRAIEKTRPDWRAWRVWRLAVAIVAILAAGLLRAPGTDNALYVVIPYVVGVFGAIMAARSLLDLVIGGEGRHVRTPEEHRERLSRRLLVGGVGAAVAAVAEVIHVLAFGAGGSYGATATAASGGVPHALLYVVLAGVSAVLLVWMRMDVERLSL